MRTSLERISGFTAAKLARLSVLGMSFLISVAPGIASARGLASEKVLYLLAQLLFSAYVIGKWQGMREVSRLWYSSNLIFWVVSVSLRGNPLYFIHTGFGNRISWWFVIGVSLAVSIIFNLCRIYFQGAKPAPLTGPIPSPAPISTGTPAVPPTHPPTPISLPAAPSLSTNVPSLTATQTRQPLSDV